MALPRNLCPGHAALLFACALSALTARSEPRSFEFDDLFRFHRISDPQVSPDGRNVVFARADVIVADNASQASVWIVPAAGGEPTQLTHLGKHDTHPRWSPDGKWIAFESDSGGAHQVWVLP